MGEREVSVEAGVDFDRAHRPPLRIARGGQRRGPPSVHVARGGELIAVLPERDAPRARLRARQLVELDNLAPHARLERDGPLLVAHVDTDALALVIDGDQDALLRADPSLGSVLTTLPPVSWTSRAVVGASEPLERNPLAGSYETPELSLREYLSPTVLSGQRVLLARSVAPEAFRDPFVRSRMRSTVLERVHPRFVRRPEINTPLFPVCPAPGSTSTRRSRSSSATPSPSTSPACGAGGPSAIGTPMPGCC